MADEKYLANRLKYHTASRIATQTGEALAQALNVDGHIVTTNKVWASPQTAFINNVNKANTDSVDATNDLVAALESPSGEYTDFRKGDYFYISVKNRNKTQATVLKQNLYNTRLETFKIGVPYGGQIRNEYVR